MKTIDVEALLVEVGTEPPCGPDLKYDSAYLEVEGQFQVRPEEGEPNWGEVRDRCIELLGRTKDLRLVLYLALTLLKTEGIKGIGEGLSLVRGLLERFWEHLHPRLDPADNNDPLERLNIIASLSPPQESFQDPMMFRQRLREVPLSNSQRLGRFSLRDILIAEGELTPSATSDAPKPEISLIEAAFDDTSTEDLSEVVRSVQNAAEQVEGIEAALKAHVDSSRVPDLRGFLKLLGDIEKRVQNHLAKRGAAAPVAEGEAGALGAEKGAEKAMSGEIMSPKDVLSALEKICQYYERHEPSSPVPLLLRRAQRLVSKNFMEIIRDLSPEATRQIESIGGISGK